MAQTSNINSACKFTLRIAAASLTVLTSAAALAQAPESAHNAPGVPPSAQGADTVNQSNGTIVSPKVSFVEPKDGETVSENFTVKFGITGMKILPAGKLVPGAGHHHLIIDGSSVKKGDVVPADATHMHFGKGQTETTLKLAPGKHTLTLQFADSAHRSYGDTMSSTISITVK